MARAALTERDRQILDELDKRGVCDYYVEMLAIHEGRSQPQREPGVIAQAWADVHEAAEQWMDEGEDEGDDDE